MTWRKKMKRKDSPGHKRVETQGWERHRVIAAAGGSYCLNRSLI
jgi:hypothetical protein